MIAPLPMANTFPSLSHTCFFDASNILSKPSPARNYYSGQNIVFSCRDRATWEAQQLLRVTIKYSFVKFTACKSKLTAKRAWIETISSYFVNCEQYLFCQKISGKIKPEGKIRAVAKRSLILDTYLHFVPRLQSAYCARTVKVLCRPLLARRSQCFLSITSRFRSGHRKCSYISYLVYATIIVIITKRTFKK